MDQATNVALDQPAALSAERSEEPVYAALDLGTNNCRLLIATPTARGFRVVDAFSRIVRLGEGLSLTGRLSEAAMERAIQALVICAERIERRGVSRLRAVATQACRVAANGADFLQSIAVRTGLNLNVISPREEAELAVTGCLDLLDREADAALVIDVGGGSTELSWLDMRDPALSRPGVERTGRPAPVTAWYSSPIGVVTLAERFPEVHGDRAWRRAMVDAVKADLSRFTGADALRERFRDGRGHIVGTSGAITSLAGVHLGLPKYERRRVDGLWMTREDCQHAADHLAGLSLAARAVQPCIGPDRADLVLAGAAILEAVQELWPAQRVRVADRGLREGLLLNLIAREQRRRRRIRRRRNQT
jgi:exopolyphosphatase/guanosine-5'-triphosphate,3'-diphosphate pyrophosphatase